LIEALNNGTIDKDSLDNFINLQVEQQRFQTTIVEKHKKDKSLYQNHKLIDAHIKNGYPQCAVN